MTYNTISQTASELLDYTIDWATRGIGTDTIASSIWAASDPSVTLSNESIVASPSTKAASSATTFWLTGGNVGTNYTITNTITTSGGRTLQETIIYNCIAQRLT